MKLFLCNKQKGIQEIVPNLNVGSNTIGVPVSKLLRESYLMELRGEAKPMIDTVSEPTPKLVIKGEKATKIREEVLPSLDKDTDKCLRRS